MCTTNIVNFGIISILIDGYTKEIVSKIIEILNFDESINYQIIDNIIHIDKYNSSKIGSILTLVDRYINTGSIIPVYKFIEDDSTFDEIKDKKVYKIWEKIDTNISKLTDKELYLLTQCINEDFHFKDGTVSCFSWLFDFKPICNKYSLEFKQHNNGVTITLIKVIIAPTEELAKEFATNWYDAKEIVNVLKLEI